MVLACRVERSRMSPACVATTLPETGRYSVPQITVPTFPLSLLSAVTAAIYQGLFTVAKEKVMAPNLSWDCCWLPDSETQTVMRA